MQSAEQFCRAYAAATRDDTGAAVAAHYVYPFVSFTHGYVSTFANLAEGEAGCRQQIGRYARAGIGYDIRMKDFSVAPVSDAAALCTITWEFFPANGMAPFSWSNVYGYRRKDGAEGFEFAIADNQVAAFLARVPDFYSA